MARPEITPSVNTIYFVTVTDSSGNCSATDSVKVTIYPDPVVVYEFEQNPVHREENTVATASGAQTYIWNPAEGLNPATGSEVTASPLVTTVYAVTGTDANGCMSTFTDSLIVNCQECGDKILLSQKGSFNHGCTENNYNDNARCSWTIWPMDVTKIWLRFDFNSFDVRSGDLVRVFDGENPSGTLLAAFNNHSVWPGVIIGGSSLYIQLIADDTINGGGFQAVWSDEPLVGLDDMGDNQLKVYPNPTSGTITIEYYGLLEGTVRLNMYDPIGKLILNMESETRPGYLRTEIDLSGYPYGVYYLQLITGKEVHTRKIIKD
jgi:hypothetical protein